MILPRIQLRGLTKIYRQGDREVLALNRVTLEISAGEFVALMGPSGSHLWPVLSSNGNLFTFHCAITPTCQNPTTGVIIYPDIPNSSPVSVL